MLFRSAAAAFALIGCNKITDNPKISFNEEVYTVAATGGELIIPVNSTGIDNVNIYYQRDGEHWQVDPETGDRIPVDGWLKLTKLIENYSVTRELAQWTSGLQLAVEPNTTGVERTAYDFCVDPVDSSVMTSQKPYYRILTVGASHLTCS